MTNTLRMTMQDGTIYGIALTDEQTMDTLQGRGFAYTPREERILVDDDDRIINRESAIPQQLDEAA